MDRQSRDTTGAFANRGLLFDGFHSDFDWREVFTASPHFVFC